MTKDEVMDPAAANCLSCFGRVVVAVHGSLKSLDSSCEISSCVGSAPSRISVGGEMPVRMRELVVEK